jgi:hypothetical protein
MYFFQLPAHPKPSTTRRDARCHDTKLCNRGCHASSSIPHTHSQNYRSTRHTSAQVPTTSTCKPMQHLFQLPTFCMSQKEKVHARNTRSIHVFRYIPDFQSELPKFWLSLAYTSFFNLSFITILYPASSVASSVKIKLKIANSEPNG